jgi:hypothetical protein
MPFHDLRHAFATLMFASGVDSGTVSALMGHSLPQAPSHGSASPALGPPVTIWVGLIVRRATQQPPPQPGLRNGRPQCRFTVSHQAGGSIHEYRSGPTACGARLGS